LDERSCIGWNPQIAAEKTTIRPAGDASSRTVFFFINNTQYCIKQKNDDFHDFAVKMSPMTVKTGGIPSNKCNVRE
jgi:hypothetical protein